MKYIEWNYDGPFAKNFVPYVEILEPVKLREKVKEYLLIGYKAYE